MIVHGFYPRPMRRPNPYMYYHTPQWPVNPSSPPQQGAGGILTRILGQTNSGTLNIEGMLGKVQKALNMAEQFTPLIQQYGPLIRNAPALLKLLKETANEENTEEKTDTSKQKKKEQLPIERKSHKGEQKTK